MSKQKKLIKQIFTAEIECLKNLAINGVCNTTAKKMLALNDLI